MYMYLYAPRRPVGTNAGRTQMRHCRVSLFYVLRYHPGPNLASASLGPAHKHASMTAIGLPP